MSNRPVLQLPPLKLPSLRPLRKSGWSVMWVSLAASLLLLGALMLVPKRPLVMFDITADYLEQIVSRPELSAIAVRDAAISAPAGCEAVAPGGVFSGVVRPGPGSTVAYSWRADAIAIGIRAGSEPARLVGSGEAECTLTATRFFVRIDNPPPRLVLPLAGAAEVGREWGVASDALSGDDLLRGGSFEVYGRSIAPWAQDVLYPITTSPISIPAGSRLSVAGSIGGERALYGVATHTSQGFAISATADASQIRLYRPGPTRQYERFAFGVFSDFFGDPQIGVIFFFFVVATSVLQILTSWMAVWREPEPETEPGSETRS